MKTVRQLLQAKGSQIYAIAPDARVFDALKLMAEKNVGALVVMEGGRLAGIISERDYARKVILHGKSSHDIAGARHHDREGHHRAPRPDGRGMHGADDGEAHPASARDRR